MKLIIVLKHSDSIGYGGEILEVMGMTRSIAEPAVFSRTTPVHPTDKLGHGDTSWSQPEATTQLYIEALMDAGIRPMRVFQRTDSTAGLTPIHAASWADAPDAMNTEDVEVADAMAAVGLGPLPGDDLYSGEDSIEAALKAVEASAKKLKAGITGKNKSAVDGIQAWLRGVISQVQYLVPRALQSEESGGRLSELFGGNVWYDAGKGYNKADLEVSWRISLAYNPRAYAASRINLVMTADTPMKSDDTVVKKFSLEVSDTEVLKAIGTWAKGQLG